MAGEFNAPSFYFYVNFKDLNFPRLLRAFDITKDMPKFLKTTGLETLTAGVSFPTGGYKLIVITQPQCRITRTVFPLIRDIF